jgi:hypothetical protein
MSSYIETSGASCPRSTLAVQFLRFDMKLAGLLPLTLFRIGLRQGILSILVIISPPGIGASVMG